MLTPASLRDTQPALFVFDADWIRDARLSLKRIVFMYECLLEMPRVEIRKGNVIDELTKFAAEHNATQIETATSPLPRIKQQGRALAERLEVTWIDPEPIVSLPGSVDLKRFSRYWRKAEKQVLQNEISTTRERQ